LDSSALCSCGGGEAASDMSAMDARRRLSASARPAPVKKVLRTILISQGSSGRAGS